MNQAGNSTGCAGKIITTFFMLFFGMAIIGSFFLMPIAKRIVLETVCQPETIVYDKWTSHRKTPTCIDKKTGKKIDAAIYEVFGCCPLVFVLFFVFIYGICKIFITRNSSTANDNSPQNFRNFKG